jgi:hypothetical protein
LERETTRFDGHKGQPLSFRRWDHQLRQPLYARTPAGFVDLPQATEPVNGPLDRLGVSSKASQCRMPA